MLSCPFLQFKSIFLCYKLERLEFTSVFIHVHFQIQLQYKMEASGFINIFEKI